MAGYLGANVKKAGSVAAVLSMRKVRAKADIFSPTLLFFMALVLSLGAVFVVNSFMKSYRNAQLLHMSAYVDNKRSESFRKTELESEYLRLVSAPSLSKRADELKLKPISAEKIISF